MNQTDRKRVLDEYVVNAREIIWSLLEQWKAILLVAILCSFLFSGMKFISDKAALEAEAQKQSALAAKTYEDIISTLGEDDQALVNSLYRITTAKSDIINYIDSSAFMNINGYSCEQIDFVFKITASNDATTDLVHAYKYALSDNTVLTELSSEWDNLFTPDQISELILFAEPNTDSLDFTDSLSSNNLLSFTVLIPEECDSTKTKDYILRKLHDMYDPLSKEFGAHSLDVLKTDIFTSFNNTVVVRQADLFSRLNNIDYQLTNLKNALSPEQAAVYENLMQYASAKGLAPESGSASATLSKRNIVVGLVLGVMLYVVVYIAMLFLTTKLQDAFVLEKAVSISTLGQWHSNGIMYNCRFASFLLRDKYIYKLHHRGHLDMDFELLKSIDSISSVCKKNNLQDIIISSCTELLPQHRDFLNALLKKLAENGIHSVYIENNPKKGHYLDGSSLVACDALVLLNVLNSSRLRDLDEIYAKCMYFNTPILGSLYLS